MPLSRAAALPPLLLLLLAGLAAAQEPTVDIDAIEQRLLAMERELAELRQLLAAEQQRREESEAVHAAETEALLDELEAIQLEGDERLGGDAWYERFTLGGYGEHHFNFREGGGGDQSDIHRFVLYLGYRFNDWLQLHSETELEHAFVDDDDGEISIEQLYTDFLISEGFNVRAGRVLAPLGIINQRHEPPTFNGVERPNVEKFVIPSTWSLDGAGVFGQITDELAYQLYLTNGLDGSEFDGLDGIRGGREKERPSLHDPAVSGRLDWYPLASMESGPQQDLRLGTSFYYGGVDNGNKGSDPGLDGDVTILSADFDYSIGDFDLRGVYAYEDISDADDLNDDLAVEGVDPGIASEIDGWYLEGGYHFMPDSWKVGKLAEADAVAFARYEEYDTQKDLPSNATADGRADREEVTVGFSFFLTPQLVVKMDYQFLSDDGPGRRDDAFNIGLGWQF